MLVAIAEHITVVELGVFMLLFLVFVFFFFLSLVFWHFRRILFVFFLIETAILLCIPYGISQISQKIIYPIEVRYDKFRPFVYTTGFNYDIEITSKAKLPIKECLLTVIPKRAGANIIKKPRHSVESSEIESSQIESNTKSNVESSTKIDAKSNAKSNIAMDSTQQSEAESSQADTTQEMADSSTKQDSTKTTQESLSQSKIAQNTQISQTKQENNDDSKTPQQMQESTNAEMQAQESKESQENKKPKKPKTPKPPSPYALKAYKILDYLAPIDAFVEVLTLDTPLTYNKKVRWQGIIRDYKYDENYGAQISCH